MPPLPCRIHLSTLPSRTAIPVSRTAKPATFDSKPSATTTHPRTTPVLHNAHQHPTPVSPATLAHDLAPLRPAEPVVSDDLELLFPALAPALAELTRRPEWRRALGRGAETRWRGRFDSADGADRMAELLAEGEPHPQPQSRAAA